MAKRLRTYVKKGGKYFGRLLGGFLINTPYKLDRRAGYQEVAVDCCGIIPTTTTTTTTTSTTTTTTTAAPTTSTTTTTTTV